MSTKESKVGDDVLGRIAKYPEDFRPIAEKLHEVIMNSGGTLYPRLWYGMPGYAKTKNGPVLVYFRKDKYITFGQTESAHLKFDKIDQSVEVAWFFTKINDQAIAKIIRVVKSAIA